MKWEYRIDEIDHGFDDNLDKAGADGWELVAVLRDAEQPNFIQFFYKRPLVDPETQANVGKIVTHPIG